jgi:hypothetical protein
MVILHLISVEGNKVHNINPTLLNRNYTSSNFTQKCARTTARNLDIIENSSHGVHIANAITL